MRVAAQSDNNFQAITVEARMKITWVLAKGFN